MSKILEIDYCNRCFYFNSSFEMCNKEEQNVHKIKDVKFNTFFFPEGKYSKYVHPIPEWCPLPDSEVMV